MTQKHLYQVDDLICVSLEREKLKLPFKSQHSTAYLVVQQVFSNERQLKCHLCIRPCETIYFQNSDAKKEVFVVTKQGEYIVHHVQVSSFQPAAFKIERRGSAMIRELATWQCDGGIAFIDGPPDKFKSKSVR